MLYGLCIKTKMDLTYKMKIGSTVTKKQYASPGGQPRNGEGMHRGEAAWPGQAWTPAPQARPEAVPDGARQTEIRRWFCRSMSREEATDGPAGTGQRNNLQDLGHKVRKKGEAGMGDRDPVWTSSNPGRPGAFEPRVADRLPSSWQHLKPGNCRQAQGGG